MRIRRWAAFVERCQKSVARCVQSDTATASSRRAGERSPPPAHRLLGASYFAFEFVRLGLVSRFVHGAGQICIEQTGLHSGEFRTALLQYGGLLPLVGRYVIERGQERGAKVLRETNVWNLELHQVVGNQPFKVCRLPAQLGMVRPAAVVRAAIVDVLAHTAAAQLPADDLPGNCMAAVCAVENPAGEGESRLARASIAAAEHVLTLVEGAPLDQSLVFPLEHLTVATQLTDVEPVLQDVRQRRPMESRLALAERMSFLLGLIGQAFERVAAG